MPCEINNQSLKVGVHCQSSCDHSRNFASVNSKFSEGFVRTV
jgi:hypothetical protein